MGKVLQFKEMGEGRVKCNVLLDQSEVLLLQGHCRDVHLVSLDSCTHKSEVLETGIKGSTKYFKIPPELAIKNGHRGRKKIRAPLYLSCQHIETKEKDLFVYIIPKDIHQEREGV